MFADDTDILNHLIMSSLFKMTCMIWLCGLSNLIYLSIPLDLRASMHHLIKQFLHHNNIRGNPINTTHSHKYLGVILSDILN